MEPDWVAGIDSDKDEFTDKGSVAILKAKTAEGSESSALQNDLVAGLRVGADGLTLVAMSGEGIVGH